MNTDRFTVIDKLSKVELQKEIDRLTIETEESKGLSLKKLLKQLLVFKHEIRVTKAKRRQKR